MAVGGGVVGDMAGLLAFAALMGTARALYGKFGEKLNMEKCMFGSAVLCVIAYLMASVSPWPIISLAGCAICGFSVGIMWPGTLSQASRTLPAGGTAMFALLALSGDVGCSVGPAIDNMQMGILAAIVFPALLLLGLLLAHRKNK